MSDDGEPALVRCDLHVHSRCSGAVDLPVLRHFGRECYSEPQEVYETARRRGMDLMTLTDHDTIEGALALAGRPDTFVSEEVTCELPQGRELHLGVFDITEAQHERIQILRRDAEALFAYLAQERIAACVNHLFSALTGRRELPDLHLALERVALVESRNGMMAPPTNGFAATASRAAGLPQVGGSDAHTLASVATAYTVVRGARNREEFLEGLRRGLTVPAGRSGSYAKLTADVVRVFAGGYRESVREGVASLAGLARLAVMLGGLPLLGLIPAFTAGIYLHERSFARHYFRQFQATGAFALRRPAPSSGPWGTGTAASPAVPA